jgi:hypothetical protein
LYAEEIIVHCETAEEKLVRFVNDHKGVVELYRVVMTQREVEPFGGGDGELFA